MKKSILKFGSFAAVALALGLSLTSCGGGSGAGNGSDSSASASGNAVVGAGSTFDQPLFSKMFAAYYDSTKLQVNYQPVGSGAGISQLTGKTVDFGGSDAPMTPKQDSTAGATVIHIPITAGAVVVSYNLPDVKDTLKFTPDVLANIYLGKITKWDDAAIAAANPGVKLPSLPILVAHRSDGSGTSAIFTSFLDKVSPEWHSKVGTSTAVNWPTGVGGKGNDGVSGVVKQTPGGIGYIELAYAIQNNISYGKVQNKSGNFIVPTPASVTAAANVTLPADGKVWISNTDAPDGYPIAGFSWVLLYQEQGYGDRTQAQAEQLVNLVNWMIHDGQKYGAPLYYAPLSPAAVGVGETLLKSVTYKGQAVLK